jgi:hypothetical protein
MSNHYHAIVYDPCAALPRFLELFHVLTARAVNSHRNRRENMWAAEQANFNFCVEQGDVLEKTVYTLANPVSAHLVDKIANWPGISSMGWLDGRSVVVERPRRFFSATGSMPRSASLRLIVPPGHVGDRAAWAEQLRARIAESEKDAEAERSRTGTRVLGRKAVRTASPNDRPQTSEPRRGLRPLIAAKRTQARVAAIEALRDFRQLYLKARLAFRRGVRSVLFPAGTYGLLHYCGVSVAPS